MRMGINGSCHKLIIGLHSVIHIVENITYMKRHMTHISPIHEFINIIVFIIK